MPTDTYTDHLLAQLLGDLGVARRHLERLRVGILRPVPAVMDEIEASVQRCADRIENELSATP